MKIKRSMVILFVTACSLCIVRGVAFAATSVPEALDATEQLAFNPLLYTVVLLAALTLASVVMSIFFGIKARGQQELVCKNYACPTNPKMLFERDGLFDYSILETPQELSEGYTGQSELAQAEAIQRQRLVEFQQNEITRMRLAELSQKLAVPHIQNTEPTHQQAVDAPIQTDEQSSQLKNSHAPKHQRFFDGATVPIPTISLVREAKHARKPSLPAVHPTPVLIQEVKQTLDMPEELECFLKKIS